jgi:ring-1,2-phenylacetyl-CoA epoxidase subunit PaaD
VSEFGTQVAIANARAGVLDAAAVRHRLATVMDPELPMISILDLGMVGSIEVGTTIRVTLLPTYVGCPALALIETRVAERLDGLGRPVVVATTFDPPWTSDRISSAGRVALAAAGVAPPVAPEAMRCPWCGSDAVVADSLFGPTQCRSLWYCRGCRQPFDAIKPI